MSATENGLAPRTMRRVVVLFRPYRLRLSAVAITVVGTAGLATVSPLLIQPVFGSPTTSAGSTPS